MWLNNILETIGNTPLIKLNKITKDLPCTVLAKVEYFNPGNSIKDRMALKMLLKARSVLEILIIMAKDGTLFLHR